MDKIIHNKVRCKICGDVIESDYTHDFKWCSCHTVAVDGGHEYCKRCGDLDNYEELSEWEHIEDNDEQYDLDVDINDFIGDMCYNDYIKSKNGVDNDR